MQMFLRHNNCVIMMFTFLEMNTFVVFTHMVKYRKELSTDTKEAIISLYNSGIKQSEISRRLSIAKTTISDILKRFKQRGSVENKSRNGAQWKLTDRDTRGLIRLVRDNRRKNLNEITNVFNQVRTSSASKRTVQRKLYSEGYHRRVIRKRIRIRKANRKIRLAWCRANRRKTVYSYWKRVIFSDECKVDIGLDYRVLCVEKGWRILLTVLHGNPPRQRSV